MNQDQPIQENNEQDGKADAFLKEYGELVKKHGVDIAPMPVFVPINDRQWVIQVNSQVIPINPEKGIPSPFIGQ